MWNFSYMLAYLSPHFKILTVNNVKFKNNMSAFAGITTTTKKYKSTAFLLSYVQCILLVKNFLTPFQVVQVLHLKYKCATMINKLMITCVSLRR